MFTENTVPISLYIGIVMVHVDVYVCEKLMINTIYLIRKSHCAVYSNLTIVI